MTCSHLHCVGLMGLSLTLHINWALSLGPGWWKSVGDDEGSERIYGQDGVHFTYRDSHSLCSFLSVVKKVFLIMASRPLPSLPTLVPSERLRKKTSSPMPIIYNIISRPPVASLACRSPPK